MSRHPVAQDGSQSLQESVQDREALGDKTFGRDRDGLFFSAMDSQYQELFPTAAVPDTCNCGVRLVHNDVKLKALMYVNSLYYHKHSDLFSVYRHFHNKIDG